MFKICHIISGDLWAGAEVMTYNLLNAQKKYSELSLSVIVLNNGRLAEELINIGIPVTVIEENRYSFNTITWRVRQILKENNQDIIHTHRYKENLIALLALSGKRRAFLIATQHGLPEIFGQGLKIKHRLKTRLNFFILSHFFTKTVAVSEDIRKQLVVRFGFKDEALAVIHNGVALPQSYKTEKEPSKFFTIGSSGRLFEIKDYPLMVEIAKLFCQNAEEIRFVLAGEGPSRAGLESLIDSYYLKSRFNLVGHIEDMNRFYLGLTIYINTSLHEGSPMTILEAMAHGLPVIAPDVGGIREIIDNGIQGFLIKGRDPKKYAQKCLKLLQNNELCISMSRAARDKVVESFTAEKMAMKYHQLYQSLRDN